MKSKSSIAIVYLIALTISFAVCTLTLWNKDRGNQKQIAELKAQVAELMQKDVGRDEQVLKQAGTDDAKIAMSSVSGIYEFEDRTRGLPTQKLDLRSNGSGIFSKLYGASEIQKKGINWSLKSSTLTTDDQKFQVEGDDLVDARGNRWLRVRY